MLGFFKFSKFFKILFFWFSKFFKIWRRLGWFWVRARRLGRGGLVRSGCAGRGRVRVWWAGFWSGLKNVMGLVRSWARVAVGWELGGRGLLLNDGLAQMASRARCARCGRDLERFKNCGGFFNGVAVWLVSVVWVVGGLASCVRARRFYKGVENLGFCCVD